MCRSSCSSACVLSFSWAEENGKSTGIALSDLIRARNLAIQSECCMVNLLITGVGANPAPS